MRQVRVMRSALIVKVTTHFGINIKSYDTYFNEQKKMAENIQDIMEQNGTKFLSQRQ